MLTEAIKAKITELFNSTPESVSVGYGKKITNGQYTGEVGIVFHVEKKLPLSEIPENEVLPSSVSIDGIEYVTDVIPAGKFVPLACDSSCYTWQTVPPPNRNKIRPLQGGISMTTFNNLGYVGTLGFIAVDVATQALVGVTNNHVACGDHFYTYFRNYANGFPTNEVNEDAYQSGESSNVSDPSYNIGKVVRYIPLSSVGNTVDGALISVKSQDISLTESFKQYGLSYNLPMAFATTAELNSLLVTNPPLYSSGRTTGAKGPGPCELTIGAIGEQITVAYSNQGVSGANAVFENCMLFTRPDPTCEYPINKGDSGSCLIANFGGVWKIIGLVFAAGSFVDQGITYHIGIANRIDDVASQLGIQAWDGTAKNYIDNDSFQYKTTTGGSLNKTLICGGSTYWQMGLTDESLPC